MATKTVRLRLELEIDTDVYGLEYGVYADVARDVEDYMVELASNCAAANSGAWVVKAVRQLAR